VRVLDYARATHTGLVYPTEKYYPTWTLEEDHPAVRAGVTAATTALGHPPAVGKWVFSTNGVATCGLFGVPTIGFGPANEVHAHTPDDQCPVDHLPKAAAFYALFPQAYLAALRGEPARAEQTTQTVSAAQTDFAPMALAAHRPLPEPSR
jgi:acetylornithine deacetylase/succinyl-diaminopimelate desuccinylase-like protein